MGCNAEVIGCLPHKKVFEMELYAWVSELYSVDEVGGKEIKSYISSLFQSWNTCSRDSVKSSDISVTGLPTRLVIQQKLIETKSIYSYNLSPV
jgi:phage terminase large subunit-like protein